MKRIAVLISNKGTGTNLQAVIDGVNFKKINAEIVAVISDTPDAPGLQRARKHKLPIKIVSKKEDLLPSLKKLEPDFICLAGWKQIILDEVIDAYPDRILNTHPGLIPDTMDGKVKNPDGTDAIWNKGKMTNKAMQNFLDNKATYAGCTNHFLSHEFDFGPVLGRCFEKIKKRDTTESLYKRLKVKENKLYVDVLARLCKKDGQTVLVVDGGGRGATLVDKYGQSKYVDKLIAVPGNDLMRLNIKKPLKIFPEFKTTSVNEIVEICLKEKVNLVDVNQDNAVAVGLVDTLKANGVQAIGPTKLAGQIEWDKPWARDFMKRHSIPHPSFKICHSTEEGINYLKSQKSSSWFIKASGLTGGYGVLPANSNKEAIDKIRELQRFGEAAKTYLIEEWLIGEEFSSYALCDGENFQILGHAQDNKRLENGDKGPNTGGIGSSSPPLVVTKEIAKQVKEIFRKTVEALKRENRPYIGILYLGGMVVEKKVYVIEFNARWGDPEVEVILPGIENDLIELSSAALKGEMKDVTIKHDGRVRLLVTACAKGYPFDLSKSLGKQIFGIKKVLKLSGAKVYGSGVKEKNGKHYVSGGRMFHIVGEGKDVLEARKKAYDAMRLISVEGDNLHYRNDIGWRDLERLRKT